MRETPALIPRAANRQVEEEKTVTGDDEEYEDKRYRYQLYLGIKHPTMRLEVISSRLNCEPTSGWNVGDMIGPTAPPRRFTYWMLNREGQDRYFFRNVKRFCTWAVEKKEAIHSLQSDAAEMTFIINLRGQYNIGDVLDCETMRMAAELNIPISVEVFPKTNW